MSLVRQEKDSIKEFIQQVWDWMETDIRLIDISFFFALHFCNIYKEPNAFYSTGDRCSNCPIKKLGLDVTTCRLKDGGIAFDEDSLKQRVILVNYINRIEEAVERYEHKEN